MTIQLARAAAGVLAFLFLTGMVQTVDETVTVFAPAGSTGNDIATLFGGAWSQSADFSCSVTANELTVADNTSTCDQPSSAYTFGVPGGMLVQGRQLSLRIQCASPTMPSFDFDSQGFVPLVPGPNVFMSGPDTLIVGLTFPPPPVPGMGDVGFAVLAALVLGAGWLLLRRRGAAPAGAA